MPPDIRDLATMTNRRTRDRSFCSSLAVVLEFLPMNLEQHLEKRGNDLTAAETKMIANQILAAVYHLEQSHVLHLACVRGLPVLPLERTETDRRTTALTGQEP